MQAPANQQIQSRDNAWFKALRKLVVDNAGYRKTGRIWIEGDHLCRAALQRGIEPLEVVFAQSYWGAPRHPEFAGLRARCVVIADALFDDISSLASPARMGFILSLPDVQAVMPGVPTVILDRVQDAGNVGSILRSAAAFGFRQVIALSGSAALWSPKVVRSGMGAHFALQLHEGGTLDTVDALGLPLVVTSSHQGDSVQHLSLPNPCAWVMGHEGQGVRPELMERAGHFARIDQPGGEESLNVAAAAAICLYASVCRAGA